MKTKKFQRNMKRVFKKIETINGGEKIKYGKDF